MRVCPAVEAGCPSARFQRASGLPAVAGNGGAVEAEKRNINVVGFSAPAP